MISRVVRIQLIIFTLIAAITLSAIVFGYAKVPALLGYHKSTLRVRLADTGGLYPNANVTYRGVPIGTITSIDLAPGGGVTAAMQLRDDIPIPTDTDAAVHSVSAIGEQYLDLVPRTAAGPYLPDGATIPEDRTSLPAQIAPVLQDVDNLLNSVPKSSLNTVINEFGKAFRGTGPDLGRLLDNTDALIKDANANYPQTKQLIDQLGPLLDTQTASSDNIRGWTRNLALFSDQLKASDTDLRHAFDHAPPAAREVSDLFQDLKPTLPILLENLITVTQVLAIYNKNIEQVLVLAPRTFAFEQGWIDPKFGGATAFELKLNSDDPPTCTAGYAKAGERMGFRPPDELKDMATKPNSYCQLPQSDPRVVRGARNLPCLEGPPGTRAPSPWQCRGDAYRSSGTAAPELKLGGGLARTMMPYDPSTGMVQGRDGPLFILGGVGKTSPRGKDPTWRNLMLDPVGK